MSFENFKPKDLTINLVSPNWVHNKEGDSDTESELLNYDANFI